MSRFLRNVHPAVIIIFSNLANKLYKIPVKGDVFPVIFLSDLYDLIYTF